MSNERRVAALEQANGPWRERVVLIRVIHGDPEPTGFRASERMPEVDRTPGESYRDFLDRVEAMADGHLPGGWPLILIAKDETKV